MEFTVRKFDLLQELMLIQGVVERKTTIPILANVLVRAEGGELGIAATDLEIGLKSVCVSKTTVPGAITLPAKRLYEIVRALPDKEIKVIVPRKAMAELIRIISEAADAESVGLSRDDNHLFFNMGKRLLISRMLTGQFPNYEAVLPRNNECIVTVNREEITAAIKRVAILSDEHSRTVKLTLSDGTMEISASHSDLGEAHETLEVDYGKDSLQVGFNFQYLLDFLTTADEPEVSFEFKDSESATQLRAQPAGDYTYRYVVMPMRI